MAFGGFGQQTQPFGGAAPARGGGGARCDLDPAWRGPRHADPVPPSPHRLRSAAEPAGVRGARLLALWRHEHVRPGAARRGGGATAPAARRAPRGCGPGCPPCLYLIAPAPIAPADAVVWRGGNRRLRGVAAGVWRVAARVWRDALLRRQQLRGEDRGAQWEWVETAPPAPSSCARCPLCRPLTLRRACPPPNPQQQARPATGGFGFGSPAPAASPFGASAVRRRAAAAAAGEEQGCDVPPRQLA
jgi:hypothetical protein